MAYLTQTSKGEISRPAFSSSLDNATAKDTHTECHQKKGKEHSGHTHLDIDQNLTAAFCACSGALPSGMFSDWIRSLQ